MQTRSILMMIAFTLYSGCRSKDLPVSEGIEISLNDNPIDISRDPHIGPLEIKRDEGNLKTLVYCKKGQNYFNLCGYSSEKERCWREDGASYWTVDFVETAGCQSLISNKETQPVFLNDNRQYMFADCLAHRLRQEKDPVFNTQFSEEFIAEITDNLWIDNTGITQDLDYVDTLKKIILEVSIKYQGEPITVKRCPFDPSNSQED